MPSACQSATEIGSIRLQDASGQMTMGSLRDGSISPRLGFVDRSRRRIGCLLDIVTATKYVAYRFPKFVEHVLLT
jgi:hypothetical protein